MQYSFLQTYCLAILMTFVMADADSPQSRPNIIVILSDDMGFSDLGCYGGEIATPNLDALAAGGVRFTQFYNTARCCPTRASLLTGLYPHQAGIGHMMEDRGKPGYRGDLTSTCRTIAEVLQPAGYRSYAVGKWHVTHHITPEGRKHNWPLQRGFDRYYGIISGASSFYDPFTLCRDNRMISAMDDPEYKPDNYYLTDALSDHAVRFLADHHRSHNDQPFFLYLAYTAAHWPMQALPADIAKYRGKYDLGYEPIRQARFDKAARLGLIDLQQKPAAPGRDWNKVAIKERESALMETYAGMVDRMDQGIGKVIAELKRTRQFEHTLIIYLQDNGGCAERLMKHRHDGPRLSMPTMAPMKPSEFPTGIAPQQTRDGYPVRIGLSVMPGPSDTYGIGWASVSNTPFREYKHWVHEGGISTPMIAHWPTGIKSKGELRHQPCHLIDVAATCYDLSNTHYPADATSLEGKSLRGTFAGEPIARKALFWEHEGNRAVRADRWKLVAKHGGPWELYDIQLDRVESNNLARLHPERVAEMAQWHADYSRRTNVEPWPFPELEAGTRKPAKKKKSNR